MYTEHDQRNRKNNNLSYYIFSWWVITLFPKHKTQGTHNKVLLLQHRQHSRSMHSRSRICANLGLFQSYMKQVLAIIILQANQHSSQLGFFHTGPELSSHASRTCIGKVCCRGQLQFSHSHIPTVGGSALGEVPERQLPHGPCGARGRGSSVFHD